LAVGAGHKGKEFQIMNKISGKRLTAAHFGVAKLLLKNQRFKYLEKKKV
jgi:hypothetical protein